MSSRPRCPCEGGTLDRHLQPTILAYLVDGPEHGYALADRLSGSPLMDGCRPDRPGVYRSLVAMESQGLVKHVVTASESGPAKRLYRLTPAGKVCLRKWTGTLERYQKEIRKLVAVMRAANSKS
jgi:DNA-binding PadR family transcriptional regulator